MLAAMDDANIFGYSRHLYVLAGFAATYLPIGKVAGGRSEEITASSLSVWA